MSIAINCAYARVALREFHQRHQIHFGNSRALERGSKKKIVEDYNEHFKSFPNLLLPYTVAVKKLPKLLHDFNQRWHPQEQHRCYIDTFSTDSWKALCEKEKQQHTVRNCEICMKSHPILVKAFPGGTYISTNAQSNSQCISLSDSDISSPRALGRKVLEEITPICQK